MLAFHEYCTFDTSGEFWDTGTQGRDIKVDQPDHPGCATPREYQRRSIGDLIGVAIIIGDGKRFVGGVHG